MGKVTRTWEIWEARKQAKGNRKKDDITSGPAAKRKKKNKVPLVEDEDEDGDEDAPEADAMSMDDSSPPTRKTLAISSDDEESDTPLSSPHVASSKSPFHQARSTSQEAIFEKVEAIELGTSGGDEDRGEESEGMHTSKPKKVRRAVVLDDSDEDL